MRVVLDMLDVGVCGTDKEITRFDYGIPPEGSSYLVIGPGPHAFAAAIDLGTGQAGGIKNVITFA